MKEINPETRYRVTWKSDEKKQEFYHEMQCSLVTKMPFVFPFEKFGFNEDPYNHKAVDNLKGTYKELEGCVYRLYQLMQLYDDIEHDRWAWGSWLLDFQETSPAVFNAINLTEIKKEED